MGYKPAADEVHEPVAARYFRQRLFNWRSDLVEESKQTIENLKEEVRDVGDEAERATRETRNFAGTAHPRPLPRLIGKIDSTLKRRWTAGTAAFCVDTGEEIGLDHAGSAAHRRAHHRCGNAGNTCRSRWAIDPALLQSTKRRRRAPFSFPAEPLVAFVSVG